MRGFGWMLLLAACAGPADSAQAPSPTIDDRSGPTDSGGSDLPDVVAPALEAVWGTAEVEAAIALGLADGLPDPWSIQATYLDVLSHGSTACPGHETYIDDTHLLGCETPSGWFYSGVSEYHVTDEAGEDGARIDGVEALGDILFRSPDGDEFEAGGHVLWTRTRDASGDPVAFSTEHQGSWKWDADDRWLGHTVSGLYRATLSRDADGRAIAIHGAAQIYAIDLSFRTVRASEACGWAPTGRIDVRDPSGGWFQVDFGETCAACGDATFAGEPAGPVCVDLTPIATGFAAQLEAL